MESPLPHSARSVALRLLAAALVAGVALAAHELVLEEEPASSNQRGSRVVDYSVESALLGTELPVTVVVPPGARDGRRSLLVFLHERGGDERSYLSSEMFSGLAAQGGKAPVVAFPRGGPDSYWHDRESGRWGTYVSSELVPALVERFEIGPGRVAIGGISMGGFGAFDIAARHPGLFCAVGGHSPAVWEEGSATAPGAFDDAEAFESHDVVELVGSPRSPLNGKVAWIDVGSEDPFMDANEALASSLRAGGAKVVFNVWPGSHESSYWDRHWRRYMRFYAEQLKRCSPGRAGREAPGR